MFVITDTRKNIFGDFKTRKEGEKAMRELGYAPSTDPCINGWFPGGEALPFMKQAGKQLWVIPWKKPLSIEVLKARIKKGGSK